MKKFIFIFALSVFLPSLASAATLSLSPSSQSVAGGQTFTVNVLIDTQGQAVDGADITYLKYNPLLLQAQQVTPGTLMPLTLSNKITSGQVQFSQVTTGGTKFNGQGTLFSVTFRALSQGTAQVTFDYTPGNTRDTNVAGNQTDLLTQVTNGSYIISGGTSVPLPVPVPPTSPTITESQITSILDLLRSFGAEESIVTNVNNSLRGVGTPSPIPGVGLGRLTAALRVGNRSAQVTILQKMLAKDYSVYPEAKVTGYYGPLTRAAVIRFQAKYGIDQVGVVGPITRARLNKLYGN